MDAKLKGGWGEAEAASFLRKKGYKIIGMGYRTRFGEIDIIAADKKFIVFAEVKTRKNRKFAHAREFIGTHKQDRIRTTASIWLSENATDLQPRFDAVEVYAPDGHETKRPEIIHYENAFE